MYHIPQQIYPASPERQIDTRDLKNKDKNNILAMLHNDIPEQLCSLSQFKLTN